MVTAPYAGKSLYPSLSLFITCSRLDQTQAGPCDGLSLHHMATASCLQGQSRPKREVGLEGRWGRREGVTPKREDLSVFVSLEKRTNEGVGIKDAKGGEMFGADEGCVQAAARSLSLQGTSPARCALFLCSSPLSCTLPYELHLFWPLWTPRSVSSAQGDLWALPCCSLPELQS